MLQISFVPTAQGTKRYLLRENGSIRMNGIKVGVSQYCKGTQARR
jgi:hypothetical protein